MVVSPPMSIAFPDVCSVMEKGIATSLTNLACGAGSEEIVCCLPHLHKGGKLCSCFHLQNYFYSHKYCLPLSIVYCILKIDLIAASCNAYRYIIGITYQADSFCIAYVLRRKHLQGTAMP